MNAQTVTRATAIAAGIGELATLLNADNPDRLKIEADVKALTTAIKGLGANTGTFTDEQLHAMALANDTTAAKIIARHTR